MGFFSKFKKSAPEAETETFLVPMDGEVQTIDHTPDDAFAQKMMGDGIVIFPTGTEVYAPVDGKVEFVFPTKHAIGMTSKAGTEFLIHVGIDTVKLDGEGFEVFVDAGSEVKAGDLLMKIDLSKLSEKAPSTATPLVFTSLGDKTLEVKAMGPSKAKDVLLVIK